MPFDIIFSAISLLLILLRSPIILSKPTKFDQLCTETYYVDKTELLKILFDNLTTSGKFHHITCPPGLGKTTNLQMIARFAQREYDAFSQAKPWNETIAYHTFKHLLIMKHPHIASEHMARYQTIYIDLKSFTSTDRTSTHVHDDLTDLLFKALNPFTELKRELLFYHGTNPVTRSHPNHDPVSMRLLSSIQDKNLTTTELHNSLLIFCRTIYQYYNSKVLVLLDNFDDAALESLQNTNVHLAQSYQTLIAILLKASIEGSAYIKYIIMTGTSTLPYGYDRSICHATRHHAFLDNHAFATYYGLTESDLRSLYDRYGIEAKEQIAIQTYYDAYLAADNRTKIYNTYSIIRYITTRRFRQKHPYPVQPFWTKEVGKFPPTFQRFLDHPAFRQNLLILLKTDHVPCAIVKQQPAQGIRLLERYRDGNYTRHTLPVAFVLMTYLFEIGYLGHAHIRDHFACPNIETRKALKRLIRGYYGQYTSPKNHTTTRRIHLMDQSQERPHNTERSNPIIEPVWENFNER